MKHFYSHALMLLVQLPDNGGIECRLYEFKLVKGGHRQQERTIT